MATPPNPNRKTHTKDGREVELIPQPHGGKLQRGNPKGPGRPVGYSQEDAKFFKIRCETLAIRQLVENGTVEQILNNPDHPHYFKVLEYVTERSMGKVPSEIDLKATALPPAVALPAKDPVVIPEAEVQILPPEPTAES